MMYTAQDELFSERLRAACERYEVVDGEVWFRADEVCRALRLNYKKALKRLPGASKRTVVRIRFHTIISQTYFSRLGVEGCIILKGGLPRARLMAVVPDAAALRQGEAGMRAEP